MSFFIKKQEAHHFLLFSRFELSSNQLVHHRFLRRLFQIVHPSDPLHLVAGLSVLGHALGFLLTCAVICSTCRWAVC